MISITDEDPTPGVCAHCDSEPAGDSGLCADCEALYQEIAADHQRASRERD